MSVKIVAPGGSYNKAITAAKYGADEIYVGVPFTSLRMRQNKIRGFEELKKTIDIIHSLKKRALLTMNIFPRNNDINIFESVVEKISDVGADAVIFSDPGTFKIIRKYLPNTDLHLSTQTSTMNYGAVQFRYDLGVKRVVLARELHIDEIKDIKAKVPGMELEVFVHGAMCMSYSGRCLLGDYMSGRPGNKGECSHACRFKYKVRLEEERRPGKLFQLQGDEDGTHIMSSKDLCVIDDLKNILPYVDALKIEGRSKSEFYVGAVVKAYRHAIDSISKKKKADSDILNLVNVIPHRQYRNGFLLNKLQEYPEGEDNLSLLDKVKGNGIPQSAEDGSSSGRGGVNKVNDGGFVTSTTLDSAGPLFNRNYFGIFTDKFIEHNKKKYFQIDPKEVITRGMKIKFISPQSIGELEIVDILNSKGKKLEKATCNTPDIYILTDTKLQGREILYS
ncbi:U32 family peptidase [Candidatus Gracilibacteria bacterium]|nr:U32 family peptidase [Candidatus Gracilibacteria bacterium]